MKIQALAVAAASLAVAAPALPAQARGQNMIRPDINTAARAHCSALQRGASWEQAIHAGMDTPYGTYWYAGANSQNRSWLSEKYSDSVSAFCHTANMRAYRAYKRGETNGPSYTGGNTNISEDPFEF